MNSEKQTEKVWYFGSTKTCFNPSSSDPSTSYIVHIGDLWILANVAHCEIFKCLLIEHIGAIMNFRTYQYYNYKVKVLNLSWGQKYYEILESM